MYERTVQILCCQINLLVNAVKVKCSEKCLGKVQKVIIKMFAKGSRTLNY